MPPSPIRRSRTRLHVGQHDIVNRLAPPSPPEPPPALAGLSNQRSTAKQGGQEALLVAILPLDWWGRKLARDPACTGSQTEVVPVSRCGMTDGPSRAGGQAGPGSGPHLAPARLTSRQDAAVPAAPGPSAEASAAPRIGVPGAPASPATPAAGREQPPSEPQQQPAPPAVPVQQVQPLPRLRPAQPGAPAPAAAPASFAEYCNALRAPLDLWTAGVTAAMGAGGCGALGTSCSRATGCSSGEVAPGILYAGREGDQRGWPRG